MANPTKSLDCRVGTAHQSRFCHCERSEAISLHHSIFLVRRRIGPAPTDSIFTTTFSFLLLLFLIASPAYAKYGGGTGEPNDPYLIFDANQMNAIGADSNDWDKHFKLMSNVDLSEYTGTKFNIIGEYVSYNNPKNKPFIGVFNGNGHKISNFTYNASGLSHPDNYRIGLFGYVDDPNAEIKDLGLIDPNVDAGTGCDVGSLVGRNGGTITACYVEGGSISGDSRVGGLVGKNEHCTITNCYSTASASGNDQVGSLVGSNGRSGTIDNCYAAGDVSGTGWAWALGGLVGYNDYGTINNSYSTGDVSGTTDVGGLVGYNRYGKINNSYSTASVFGSVAIPWYGSVGGLVGRNRGIIANCYATGRVMGEDVIGGLVGYNYRTVSTSFWDTENSGQSTSDGGTGKTTPEMQMISTFTDVGWDFTTPVWTIDEGNDYPRLCWQAYGGGSGTVEDPYLIYTAEQLNTIGLIPAHWDKLIRITCAPRFVYHSAKGTHLSGLTEDELIPLREWLVLDDGSRKYKLKWPTPGLSPGSLMTSNVYTFVLRKQGSQYIIEKTF